MILFSWVSHHQPWLPVCNMQCQASHGGYILRGAKMQVILVQSQLFKWGSFLCRCSNVSVQHEFHENLSFRHILFHEKLIS